MTGFGEGRAQGAACSVHALVRSVNHRHFEVRTRVDPDDLALTHAVESLARERLERGRVDVHVRVRPHRGEILLDGERVRTAYRDWRELLRELSPDERVSMPMLAALPGLYRTGAPDAAEVRETVLRAIEEALHALLVARTEEGGRLHEELRLRGEAIRTTLGVLSEHIPKKEAEARQRLAERLRVDGALPDERVRQELILCQERTDVSEELSRFRGHLEVFFSILDATDGVGKKIDFVLQEMSREINTLCAKVACQVASTHAIAIKVELERMREQAQNIQ